MQPVLLGFGQRTDPVHVIFSGVALALTFIEQQDLLVKQKDGLYASAMGIGIFP